jgi:hypothetical protein
MMTAPSARRAAGLLARLEHPWWQFGLFVLATLVTRLVVIDVPIVDLDEASYLVGARDLLNGGRLYVTFADHKPPLVYVYYAACLLLHGGDMTIIRWITMLIWIPLTALGLSAFFGWGRRGLAAGLIWIVYGAAYLGHDMLAVNCELLMMLPLVWALVVARGPRTPAGQARSLGVAGLLIGIAVLFKYQAIFWAPALVLDAWLVRRWRAWRAVFALAVGVTVPLVATYALFAARGTGGDFLYWNVTHNLLYTSHTTSWPSAAQRLAAYLLPFLITVSPLAWAWWQGRRCADRQALLLFVAACSLWIAFLGWRFYPHYFIPLYVPLALGATPFVADGLRDGTRHRRWVTAASVLPLAGFTVANFVLYHSRYRVLAETRPVVSEVTARLQGDPCFGSGPLFVWGYAPIFYATTGLRQATRFVFVDNTLVGHVSGGDEREDDLALIVPEHWDWLMSDLARTRPTYVLDLSPAHLWRWSHTMAGFPRLARWLSMNYDALDVIDGVRIFRLRGCQGQGLIDGDG